MLQLFVPILMCCGMLNLDLGASHFPWGIKAPSLASQGSATVPSGKLKSPPYSLNGPPAAELNYRGFLTYPVLWHQTIPRFCVTKHSGTCDLEMHSVQPLVTEAKAGGDRGYRKQTPVQRVRVLISAFAGHPVNQFHFKNRRKHSRAVVWLLWSLV